MTVQSFPSLSVVSSKSYVSSGIGWLGRRAACTSWQMRQRTLPGTRLTTGSDACHSRMPWSIGWM